MIYRLKSVGFLAKLFMFTTLTHAEHCPFLKELLKIAKVEGS